MTEKNIKTYKPNKTSVLVSGGLFIVFLLFFCFYFFIARSIDGSEEDYKGAIVSFLLLMAFFNILLYNLKKEITTSSLSIKNTEIPISPLFFFGKKNLLEINWTDIKALKKGKGLLLKSNIHSIIAKDGKIITFTPSSIKDGKELIQYIEEKSRTVFT